MIASDRSPNHARPRARDSFHSSSRAAATEDRVSREVPHTRSGTGAAAIAIRWGVRCELGMGVAVRGLVKPLRFAVVAVVVAVVGLSLTGCVADPPPIIGTATPGNAQ